MGTPDDAKDKVVDAAQSRGEQLDEALGKAGDVLEEKVSPVGEKVADKVVDTVDRSSEQRSG